MTAQADDPDRLFMGEVYHLQNPRLTAVANSSARIVASVRAMDSHAILDSIIRTGAAALYALDWNWPAANDNDERRAG